jgi:YfiH family protein
MIKIQIPEFNSINNYKIKHVFLCNIKKPDNFSQIIRKNFNNTDFILLKQIHSDISHIFSRHNYREKEGDALITTDDSISLCVWAADCVPILLADHINKVIGAVHAGWKGAKAGIIDNAIRDMIESGAEIKNITVAIGPTITQDNYEVGIGFYQQFINENKKNESFFKEEKNRLFFDLYNYVRNKLLNLNISQENIFNCNLDTFSNKGIASHRRFVNNNLPNDTTNLSLIALRSKNFLQKPFVEKTEEWINFSSDVEKLKNNKIIQKYNIEHSFHTQNDTIHTQNNISDEVSNEITAEKVKNVIYLQDCEEKEILKKLRTKKIRIERKIDLHGKNVDEAYLLLNEFLTSCYYSGLRYLLVIVGRGKNGEGVIRLQFKSWIENNPEICDKVMLLRESLPEHGGDGSYYVFFRRKKL